MSTNKDKMVKRQMQSINKKDEKDITKYLQRPSCFICKADVVYFFLDKFAIWPYLTGVQLHISASMQAFVLLFILTRIGNIHLNRNNGKDFKVVHCILVLSKHHKNQNHN